MRTKEEIYQEVLKKHWDTGDMNNLAILGAFGRELVEEAFKEGSEKARETKQ